MLLRGRVGNIWYWYGFAVGTLLSFFCLDLFGQYLSILNFLMIKSF